MPRKLCFQRVKAILSHADSLAFTNQVPIVFVFIRKRLTIKDLLLALQPLFNGLAVDLIPGFVKQGKHVFLIGFYPGLVEGIHP